MSPASTSKRQAWRTTNRRVYAVGDVAGSLQFTHVANYHAGIVLRALLFRLPARQKLGIVPWATFTDPELAQVGMSEADAEKAGMKFRILRWPYAENDRAQAERRTEGHIKIIAGRGGRILGVAIVGANAAEMINMWALAIAKRLNLRDMAGYVAPYPTMSEIGKRAAITYFAGTAGKPLVRRLIGFLRRFG
jgi:pyruvate/2-oxoglutarate dehydrogenase complex dihydrolipoamide dehydrogenase (E3) component